MNKDIKEKYKDLFIALIEGEDWQGARNLIDNIITTVPVSTTIVEAPPIVEQVPKENEAVQGTSYDDLRARGIK